MFPAMKNAASAKKSQKICSKIEKDAKSTVSKLQKWHAPKNKSQLTRILHRLQFFYTTSGRVGRVLRGLFGVSKINVHQNGDQQILTVSEPILRFKLEKFTFIILALYSISRIQFLSNFLCKHKI